jgi:hypothetical protein
MNRTPCARYLLLFIAATLPDLLACGSHHVRAGSEATKAVPSSVTGPRATVTVTPRIEAGQAILVDEEYISSLTLFIRRAWGESKASAQLVHPITVEVVLKWDGYIQSVSIVSELKPDPEDMRWASEAIESVFSGHLQTHTGQSLLYAEDNGVRRRCMACTGRILVTFLPFERQ